MHYLLIYDLQPDYMEKRGDYRTEHLELAWKFSKEGHLLMGGALRDPSDQAFLLFECDSPNIPEQFAVSDPYVKNGLVKRWKVRPWVTVAGEHAFTPVKP